MDTTTQTTEREWRDSQTDQERETRREIRERMREEWRRHGGMSEGERIRRGMMEW